MKKSISTRLFRLIRVKPLRFNPMVNKLISITLICLPYSAEAAISAQLPKIVPSFKVSLRVGLHGQIPVSFTTVAKSGKKSFITEISDDGQVETSIEMFTKKSQVNNRDGLYMDLTVTKRVRGIKKASERTQVFVPDNQEFEIGENGRGHTAANLSLAIVAHQL